LPSRFKLEHWTHQLTGLIKDRSRALDISLDSQSLHLERVSVEHTDFYYGELLKTIKANNALKLSYVELLDQVSALKQAA